MKKKKPQEYYVDPAQQAQYTKNRRFTVLSIVLILSFVFVGIAMIVVGAFLEIMALIILGCVLIIIGCVIFFVFKFFYETIF